MIWQNPWAWLGLASIALPVLVHLFGRGHARVHRFPTLRFLDASRLLPTRRTRIHDLLLLAVRVAMLFVAIAALARPLFITARRTSFTNAALARAVIVDTSASMASALDSARRAAASLANDASASLVIETSDPSRALVGASAWLGTQSSRGEIAVVSDFQTGTLDSADVAVVPSRIGVRLVRIASRASSAADIRASDGSRVHVATPADRTDVEWSTSDSRSAVQPLVLAGASERRRADAALAAAASIPVALPLDSSRAIAIVEREFDGRAGLLARATIPRQAWMMDIVARLAADPTLAAAARTATVVADADSAGTLVLARNDSGRAVAVAAEGNVQGRERLVLYSLADAGSLTSAALIAAAAHATSIAPPLRELDQSFIPDAELARWRRAPAVESRPRGTGDDSDGHWLWIAVLALLAIETWMRRERRELALDGQIARDRAA
ncbi:MAG: BatA domain-containing protein [Gemmatimonadaceae bacterium]